MVRPRGFAARNAQVAELADALASGASSRKGVEVRVLSWAPVQIKRVTPWSRIPVGGPFSLCAAERFDEGEDGLPAGYRVSSIPRVGGYSWNRTVSGYWHTRVRLRQRILTLASKSCRWSLDRGS
jgi:hypothetical protein